MSNDTESTDQVVKNVSAAKMFHLNYRQCHKTLQ